MKNALTGLPPAELLHVNFEDDDLLSDRDYFFSVLEAVLAVRPGTTFSAENGLDATSLDADTLERLLAAGFRSFNLSLGSADPAVLPGQRRQESLTSVRDVLARLKGTGATATTYFIAGLEGDTGKSVVESILTVASLPTLVGISPFYAVPGLPGFENTDRFQSGESHRCCGSAAYPWTGALSTAQLLTAIRLARLANCVKRDLPGERERLLIGRVLTERRLYTLVRGSRGATMSQVAGVDDDMVGTFFSHRSMPALFSHTFTGNNQT